MTRNVIIAQTGKGGFVVLSGEKRTSRARFACDENGNAIPLIKQLTGGPAEAVQEGERPKPRGEIALVKGGMNE